MQDPAQHVITVISKLPAKHHHLKQIKKSDLRKEVIRLVEEFDYCLRNMNELDLFWDKYQPKSPSDYFYLYMIDYEFKCMCYENDELVNTSFFGAFIHSFFHPYKDFIT